MKKPKDKNPIIEETNTRIFINIIIAVFTMLFFVVVHLVYDNMQEHIFTRVMQISTITILAISIIIFEIAYKKDNGILAINGIEVLVLACHVLSISYITQIFNFEFTWYITISTWVFAIYYVFKSIVVYTVGRKKYLKSLSDISEIVKKEKPTKKVATKKVKNND